MFPIVNSLCERGTRFLDVLTTETGFCFVHPAHFSNTTDFWNRRRHHDIMYCGLHNIYRIFLHDAPFSNAKSVTLIKKTRLRCLMRPESLYSTICRISVVVTLHFASGLTATLPAIVPTFRKRSIKLRFF